MMMRGAWGNATKFVAVVTLLCGTVLLTFVGGAGKPSHPAKANSPAAQPGTAKTAQRWAEAYGKLPLSFEENQGQTARGVRYVSHGRGYELFLTSQEAVLALQPRKHLDFSPSHRVATIRALREANKARAAQQQLTAVRLQLDGANPSPQISGLDRLPARVNYFIGNDPKNWHTGVPSFARVKYTEVYPGVDLVFYGNQRKLEYDFIVAPGTDPSRISFKVDGPNKMRINARGDLALSVPGGEVELQKPIVYQLVNGQRREIEGKYAIDGAHRVRFTVAAYDRSAPLILDPVLSYSTYLGGTGAEDDQQAGAIALDGSGDAFIAGNTTSVDFPAGSKGGVVATPTAPNNDASFVAELDPTGANLLYSTYLAGSTTSPGENAFGIAVDTTGKVYVTGLTFATDFPTTPATAVAPAIPAYQPTIVAANAANGTVYLTKLDPTVNGAGALLYSTYVSGTGGEFANCVAADVAGNAYLAGFTLSTDFPTANPLQSAPEPANTFGTSFVTRIDTTKSGAASLIFSTYFGGNGANQVNFLKFGEEISGIAVDSSQNAYVTGQTSSTDAPASFITSGTAYQSGPPAANTKSSAFLSKINTTAGTLTYSTYLAGSSRDEGFAVALGPGSVAYLTGDTISTDFPFPGATSGAFNTAGAASGNAFITLIDTTKAGASGLKYSTFLGGTGGDIGYSIKADASGNAYVAGVTQSSDFAGAGTLDALGALQTARLNNNGDAFVAKLNPAGGGKSDLLYATYYGGSGNGGVPPPGTDAAFGLAIDSANPPNAYITGVTSSTNLPVLSALPKGGSLQGSSDAFVAKFALVPTLTVAPSPFNFGTQPQGVASTPQQFTVTNNTASTATFSSIVTTGVSPANNTDFAVSNDACSPAGVGAGLTCTVSVTFTPSVAAGESSTLVITGTITNGGQNSAMVLKVNLTGTGTAALVPAVTLTPTSLPFGGQMLTTTSAAMPVTLKNTGTGALTINSIAASGDFAETSTGAGACPIGPATLGAGLTCTINVTFSPTAVGARPPGTLTVTDNAGGSPHSIPLTGTGFDFTVTATTPQAGKSPLMFNATLTSLGGFNQPVAFTCNGAPAGVTCAVATPVTGNPAAPQNVQVTLTRASGGLLVPPSSPRTPPLSPWQIVPLLLAVMLLSLLPRAKALRVRLGLITVSVLLVALAGCSGAKPVQPINGNITITGKSTGAAGSVSHSSPSVAFTLN